MSLFKVYLLYIVKCKWNTVILYEALHKVYSITIQCLLLDYIPILSMKSLNDWGHSCSPNIWLHPSTSLGHCKHKIENMVYKCGSCLIRNTHMSSASSAYFLCFASQLIRHAASLLFLFFFSLAVDPVQFLVLPLSDIVTLCWAPAIYIYLPVDGSWDAPSLEKVKIHLGAICQFRTDLEKKLMEMHINMLDILWHLVQPFCM